MKTKQTAPLPPELLASQPLELATFMQALHESGLLFPLLQAGLRNGYFAQVGSAKPMLLSHAIAEADVTVKFSIQYESSMAGCACDDDPTPQQPLPEFLTCTLTFDQDGWLKTHTLDD